MVLHREASEAPIHLRVLICSHSRPAKPRVVLVVLLPWEGRGTISDCTSSLRLMRQNEDGDVSIFIMSFKITT